MASFCKTSLVEASSPVACQTRPPVIRAALADEALARGLKCRISDMHCRLDRLQDRTSKRRQIAKDVMVELDLKKLNAPDFTASIREGIPSLIVINEEE